MRKLGNLEKQAMFSLIRIKALTLFTRKKRTLAEIAKVELDNMPLRGKQLRVHFACHSAPLTVRNLPRYMSNELLEAAFSVFGQVERAVVIVDAQGRPSGKGIVEFSGKPTALKALDRCSEGSFLLTTFPRPVTVEPMDHIDDEEGLPEKLVIKTNKQTNKKPQQFHKKREQPPRSAQLGSFEYEYATRWKALVETEKQQQWTGTSRRLARSWRWRWRQHTMSPGYANEAGFDEMSRRASEDGGAA